MLEKQKTGFRSQWAKDFALVEIWLSKNFIYFSRGSYTGNFPFKSFFSAKDSYELSDLSFNRRYGYILGPD